MTQAVNVTRAVLVVLGKSAKPGLKNGRIGPVVGQPIGGRGIGKVRLQRATVEIATLVPMLSGNLRERERVYKRYEELS
jgi:hypothetical protein